MISIGDAAKRVTLPPLPSEAMPPRPIFAPLRKQCSRCGSVRLYDHFGQDKRASDGLRSQCRHCERAYDRARYRRGRERRVG